MAETAGIAEERWEGLLDAIELGKVVPIVGRRLSLVSVDGAAPVPLESAAAARMGRDLGFDPLPPGWGLAEVHRAAAEGDAFDIDAFHPKLKRLISGMTPHLDPLLKLARITHFRLLLSTAFDSFLEQAVHEARGGNETVCTYTFAPGYENPLRPIARPGEVCVYHLLGSRDTCPNWAVTAEDLVEFVLGLISDKYRPEQLFAALKDKHLLAIGCQIPDWLGRFFLRALRNGPISQQKGLNVLVDDTFDADAAFARYLEQFGKKALVVPGDPGQFVNDLYDRWKARVGDESAAGTTPAAPPPTASLEQPAKVFLSYAHADGEVAQRLYDYLRGKGIDVWKDDRDDALVKGGNWDHEIRRQIADCACFIALLSPRAVDPFTEGYYREEWIHASARRKRMDPNRRFIFPVLSERGVELPEPFKDSQWTLLDNDDDRDALARSLREEQRRLRKEAR